MNYAEQQQYLNRSRIWSAGFVLVVILAAWRCWVAAPPLTWMNALSLVLTVAALAGSLFYSPDYLHLNVNSEKKLKWEIKIRWRLIAAGLLIGIISVHDARGAVILLVAIAWLTSANLLAKSSVLHGRYSAHFGATDLALLASLLLVVHADFLLIVFLGAAAVHLFLVTCEKSVWTWAIIAFAFFGILILYAAHLQSINFEISLLYLGLPFSSALATAFLVDRAYRHNTRNVNEAIRELADFTGYSGDRIRELWATSNQKLARNWQAAGIAENDREIMAQWYRDNSELYMFAISGYNLEYKRIISNLRMLKYGRGACLDYGAGNGEIVLEIARRGQPATYFDVDGQSMQFARQRAERRGLSVMFLQSKEQLAASAKKRAFDTVFSFDVLEHIPDLRGELSFLASLLSPGGLFVFDVPAGSTKSHPMHLNHRLDIHEHMQSLGLAEERSFWQRFAFRKQEKYFFRAAK